MEAEPWRVFLSHTSELRDLGVGSSFIEAAEEAVKQSGNAVVDMAYFTAASLPPARLCVERVTGSDVYVGVIGFRYGSPVPERPDVSYTELEFEAATTADLPRLVFLLDDERTVGPRGLLLDRRYAERQEAFRTRLQDAEGITVRGVASPQELQAALVLALQELRDRRRTAALAAPPPAVGPVMWLPEMMFVVVERPRIADELAEKLRAPGVGPVGITAVHGGGGFGKTTMAGIGCRRPDVQAAFPDGVLWIDLGQDLVGARLAEMINGLSRRLGEDRPGPSDPMQAGMRFGELLGDRRILLVIDDVWSHHQLTPLLQGGPSCRRLVTTRDRATLPAHCPIVSVDVMELEQAARLLTDAVPELGDPAARTLALRCGRWPVLLRLVAGHLSTRISAGMAAPAALEEVGRGLDEAGVAAFDDLGARERAVATTVEASLGLLSEPGATDGGPLARYLELAVFAEDVTIPRQVLEVLWGHTAGWPPWETRRFCDRLADLALVQGVADDAPGLRLHDVIHHYIRSRIARPGTHQFSLPEMHRRLLDAYRPSLDADEGRTRWWRLPATEGYLWANVPLHLREAGEHDELAALARDLRWAAGKVHRMGSVPLEADMSLLPDDPAARALGRLVRQTGHLRQSGDSRATVSATLAAYAAGVDTLRDAAAKLFDHVDRPALYPAAPPLPDQPDPALTRTLTGHQSAVAALASAPDGSWLASGGGGDVFGGGDGTIRIWRPTVGVERGPLVGHPGGVSALVVASDGSWLASAGRDGAVRVWDAATGAERSVLTTHTQRVSALAVAPDGSWLASGGLDATVWIRELGSGLQRALRDGQTGWVSALAVAPDGSWLASAADGTVRIWAAPSGAPRTVLTGHTGWVSALAVAPDGRWIATAGGDRTVRLWDPATGAPRLVLNGHDDRVSALVVAPDGSWLASASGHAVRLWDPGSGAALGVLAGHTGPVTALAAAPDGSWLAAAAADGAVRIWDPRSGEQQSVLTGHAGTVNALVIAPNGGWLASAGADGTVRIWDPASGRLELAETSGLTNSVSVLAAPPAGPHLVSGGADGVVRLWRPGRGGPLATLDDHSGRIAALVIARDGAWVASADEDGAALVWETESGVRRPIVGHVGRVSALAAAADGSWLASGGIDATVRIWDPSTATQTALLDGHTNRVTALAASPDGRWLASGGIDATVRIWDPVAARQSVLLGGHTSGVSALAVAPDGKWLASGGIDATVRIWDPSTGVQTALLGGHTDGVAALVMAPDGSWLASAGRDRTVRIWDPDRGVGRLVLLDDALALAVSPDGAFLASAGRDRAVRVWDARTGALVSMIRLDGPLYACVWGTWRGQVVVGGARGLYVLGFAT
ncbi:MAG: NB-ARC domain-containing protein [Frankia sp.]